jgi:hypothetical protein
MEEDKWAEGSRWSWRKSQPCWGRGSLGSRVTTRGQIGHAVLNLVWEGLSRWRQPGLEWGSIPGLHKGHIECPTSVAGPSYAWLPSHPTLLTTKAAPAPHTAPCDHSQCLS